MIPVIEGFLVLRKTIPDRLKRGLTLIGLAASLGLCSPAHADDLDPFQVDHGHWMSFERYNDNLRHNRPVGNEAISATPVIETPALATPANNTTKSDGTDQGQAQPAADESVAAAPAIAAPTRPLDLPLLPGVNKGFNVRVDSTSDVNATTPAQIVETKDGESEMHLQEQNWQDAAEIARQHADDKNGLYKDSEHAPLDVRMTFLPNPKVTPETGPERKPRIRLVDVPSIMKHATAETQKTPAECAAIDAYKKKQLEAIQSDRKTLQALQSAIADLGLQKQLNFMAGAQQSPTLSGGPSISGSNPVTATP